MDGQPVTSFGDGAPKPQRPTQTPPQESAEHRGLMENAEQLALRNSEISRAIAFRTYENSQLQERVRWPLLTGGVLGPSFLCLCVGSHIELAV